MYKSQQKQRRYMTLEQREILVAFMANNPKLRTGKFSSSFTIREGQDLWQQVTEELNKISGGPTKDWRMWRKTWHDLQSAAKNKDSTIRFRSGKICVSARKKRKPKLQGDQKPVSHAGSASVNFKKNERVPEVFLQTWDNQENGSIGEFECLESDEEVVQRSMLYETDNKEDVDPLWPTQNIKTEQVSQEANNSREEVLNGKKTEINFECNSSADYYKMKSAYYKKKLKLMERGVKAQEQLSEDVKALCQIILENLSS